MKASKIAYKPVGLALSAFSGVAAGALFKQAWKMLGHDEDAPDATDEDRSWRATGPDLARIGGSDVRA